MMTKREVLIDNKERIEEALSRVQLQPIYNGIRYEDEYVRRKEGKTGK